MKKKINNLENREQLIIIQLSDLHLFSEDDATLFQATPNRNFYKIIENIKNAHLVPDLFLLTGDLSQDESKESYKKIANVLSDFNLPIYWIPGNHDNLEAMQTIFNNCINFQRGSNLKLKYFDLIFLNTKLENSDNGYLTDSELNFLEECAKYAVLNGKKIIIVMHHHPVAVGTPLLDKFILNNSDSFFEVAEKINEKHLVICGHVHGNYHIEYGKTEIEAAPATCFQWPVGTTTLEIEKKIVYKIFYLNKKNYQSEVKLWDFS